MGSARGDRGGRTGAGAPPVAVPGKIGLVASHLPINAVKWQTKMSMRAFRLIETTAEFLKEWLRKAQEIVKSKRESY